MSNGAQAPNGVVLGVEVHWCPGCRGDKAVEMVRLTSDPEPVAVCTECGVGLEAWLTVELVEQRRPSDEHGRREQGHGEQGHGEQGHGAA